MNKICVAITGPSIENARNQLLQAQQLTTLVELRLDFIKNWTLEDIRSLRQGFSLSMIFTLRPISQGGTFAGSENERLALIAQLASLGPEFLDIESTTQKSFVTEIKHNNPSIAIIISYHDFEKVPALKPILDQMQGLPGDLFKIAVMPHSTQEALDLLIFMRDHQPNVLMMGMGSFGVVTRILGPIFGAAFVYACLDAESRTAPDQPTLDELTSIYHFDRLNSNTMIYALIGDPVDKSLGHYVHNAVMTSLNLSAVYVKLLVTSEQLPEFMASAKKLGIRGLSVTMPLKEKIVPFINELDSVTQQLQVINTVVCEASKTKAYNTDAKGALDAIEEKITVEGKRILILGAGGTARALAFEALTRHAQVIILNRDVQRAEKLGESLHCRWDDLNQMPRYFEEGYDILINCTPILHPIDPKWIIPKTVVMDVISRPHYTPFLLDAQSKDCTLVFGSEMWINQAVGQYHVWFGDQLDLVTIKKLLQEQWSLRA